MSPHLSTLTDKTLLDLYASAAEPARWPRALDQLCLQTGARSAVAVAFSLDNGRTQIHWKAMDSRAGRIQFPPDSNVPTNSNPRVDHRRVLRSLNRIIDDEGWFDPGDEACRRLQQQLAAVGWGRFIGTLQEVSPGVFLALDLHRALDDPLDFGTAQVGYLAALTPHLRQAFVLTDRLQESLMHDRRLREHLDRLRCGIVLCDAAARVHWLNGTAERLLTTGPLRLVAARLRGNSTADTAQLMHELAEAEAASGTVRYLRLGHGEGTRHVAIQAASQPSTMVLILTSASRGADIPTDALIRLFGLTPTEARLVAALATGSTVEQYAQQRGVSVGTARVQLKQVQAKTGARRQAELVGLVLSSAAAHLVSGCADPAEPSS
jgi:DNA-binding CsgD family transcriptional regulator